MSGEEMSRERDLEILLELSERSKLPRIKWTRLNWAIELAEIKLSKIIKGAKEVKHEH